MDMAKQETRLFEANLKRSLRWITTNGILQKTGMQVAENGY